MNNQQKPTPEQALQILTEVSNLENLKLNKREHVTVEAALAVFKELIDARNAKAEVALTPAAPEVIF